MINQATARPSDKRKVRVLTKVVTFEGRNAWMPVIKHKVPGAR